MTIRVAPLPADADARLVAAVQSLLREYQAFVETSTGFRTQRLEREIAELPNSFDGEGRVLLVAYVEEAPVGCVAIVPLIDTQGGELKRLWVGEEYRGQGVAERLVRAALAEARRLGYRSLVLDTDPAAMPAAFRLYQRVGFTPCEPYRDPALGMVYMRYREAV